MTQEVIKSTCKKFHDDPQAWLRSLKIRIREKDRDGARSVLEKAMRTLPKSKHVEMATQSALMEFREGSAERGR